MQRIENEEFKKEDRNLYSYVWKSGARIIFSFRILHNVISLQFYDLIYASLLLNWVPCYLLTNYNKNLKQRLRCNKPNIYTLNQNKHACSMVKLCGMNQSQSCQILCLTCRIERTHEFYKWQYNIYLYLHSGGKGESSLMFPKKCFSTTNASSL